jgi:precorrin-6B methylase 2
MTEGPLRDWWEELLQVHEFNHYRDYAADLTRREVDFLIAALSLRGTETILDLGCGSGRHSLELARRGFTVVGVDLAAPVLAHARAQAAAEGLSVEFVQGDMRELHFAGRFDVALLLNSSLGGRLVLQCINPYRIESYLREFRQGWYALGSGYVLREADFDPRSATLAIAYRYIDPSQSLDVAHPGDRIRLYGFPELITMLTAAGLRPLSAFGDAVLPPTPFDANSQWQIAVAVRDQPLSSPTEAANAD